MTTKSALFITRYLPFPKHTGALMWSSLLINLFSQISTRVDVLCQTLEFQEDSWEGLHSNFPPNVFFHVLSRKNVSLLDSVLTFHPNSSIPHNTKKNAKSILQFLRKNPDYVVIDHIGSTWVYDHIKRYISNYPHTKLVYCAHNFEYNARLIIAQEHLHKPFHMITHFIDAIRILLADWRIFKKVDLLITSANSDKRKYEKKFSPKKAITILPVFDGEIVTNRKIDKNVPKQICLVGSFIWSAKKIDLEKFLKTAWTRLNSQGINLLVVGKMETQYFAKMRSDWPDVEFTGVVESVEPYIKRCRIGVLPEVAGGGFQWKAMSYVFNRLPIFGIVGTNTDMPLEPGKSIEVYPDRESLVSGIIKYINDCDHLNVLQKNAFEKCSYFMDPSDRTLLLNSKMQSLSYLKPQNR